MAEWPPWFRMVEVTGTWMLFDGCPVPAGSVTLTPSVARLVVPGELVVVADPIVLPIGPDGTVSGVVPATDSPGVVPEGWYYRVRVVLSGASECPLAYEFDLEAPADAGLIDLSAYTPPSPPEDPHLCVLSVNGMTGHVIIDCHCEGGGAVDSVNGQTGDVVLDAGDVGAISAETVGEPGGVAGLGPDGKVPAEQLPDIIGEPGPPGLSAYQVAVVEGYEGTEAEWLESLVGADGEDGASAYQVAVAEGYTGTEAEWLASLVGPRGPEGPQGEQGEAGTGVRILGSLPDPDELPGTGNEVGDAYLIDGDLWVWDGSGWGNVGTIQGPTGPEGEPGADGVPVELRTTGTHVQWRYLDQDPWMDLVELDSITGPRGPEGPQGLQGPEGPQGEPGLERVTVAGLTWPQIIGHRGAQGVAPENTAAGFDVALAAGTQILELDVHLAGDGSLIINHDATLSRTHGNPVQVRDLFAAATPIHPVQPSLLGFPLVWEPQPMLTLDAVFARYWSAPVVWLIEVKAFPGAPAQVWQDTTRAVTELLSRWNLIESAIVQSFNIQAALTAVSEGIPAGYIETAGATAPEELLARGIDYYGIRHDAPVENLQAAADSDIRLLGYTVNRHADRDRLLDLGADGVVTDDPTYMALVRSPSSRDGFRAGTWPPGHLASPINPVRGILLPGGGLELQPPVMETGSPGNYTAIVVGYLSPLPSPRSFTLTAELILDEAITGVNSAQIQLAETDVGYHDDDHSRVNAYNLLIRANGGIDLYRALDGQVNVIASESGPPPERGETVIGIQIVVEGPDITVTRTDVSPAVVLNATDTAIHPAYVGLGVRTARARFLSLERA